MKRIQLPLLLMLAMLVSRQAPAGTGGTISGAVVVAKDGTAVAPEAVNYLYVYLEEKKPTRRPGDGMTATITQSAQQFDPRVVVIPEGGTVWFPNKDSEDHSVFSPSGTREDGFDLGRYGRSKRGKSQRFLESKAYSIYCDIHMEMWAYVKVVPSRYWTPVVKGRFSLIGVPPGTYRVAAWAPGSRDVLSEWITITGEETRSVAEMHLQLLARATVHVHSDGSSYKASEIYNAKKR